MAFINCTLLTDGPSDIALLPILKWVVEEHAKSSTVQIEWADLTNLPHPPRSLGDRICCSLDLYPCRILFVHRDAEGQAPDMRYTEISNAVNAASPHGFDPQYVCVVPIRMQEAWLLLDETAIRRSAGNPNGPMILNLPSAGQIESLPNPKDRLYDILKCASGLNRRRLKKFRPDIKAKTVSNHMSEFSCLRVLSAFRRLEVDVKLMLKNLGLT